MTRAVSLLGVLFSTVLLTACGSETSSFSLLSDSDTFQQGNNKLAMTKVDILWVVDNSGSMQTSQTNLANNFNSFINNFSNKNLDYQIAVTGTDAWRGGSYSLFSDNSGHSIITPETTNLVNSFISNVTLGVSGTGDERAFQSLQTSIDDTNNAGFLRDDSFLAVVIISDEDDFSHDDSYFIGNNTHPALHSPNDYVTYLDNATNSSGATRRYNVSAMAIWDEACRDQLNLSWNGRIIGTRYGQLVDATDGIKGSLCGDFASELENISDKIVSLATQFYLSRVPKVSTIKVIVDGTVVPVAAENPGPTTGGWTYDANANSIVFSGDHIPAQGSQIDITYDPLNYGS